MALVTSQHTIFFSANFMLSKRNIFKNGTHTVILSLFYTTFTSHHFMPILTANSVLCVLLFICRLKRSYLQVTQWAGWACWRCSWSWCLSWWWRSSSTSPCRLALLWPHTGFLSSGTRTYGCCPSWWIRGTRWQSSGRTELQRVKCRSN